MVPIEILGFDLCCPVKDWGSWSWKNLPVGRRKIGKVGSGSGCLVETRLDDSVVLDVPVALPVVSPPSALSLPHLVPVLPHQMFGQRDP